MHLCRTSVCDGRTANHAGGILADRPQAMPNWLQDRQPQSAAQLQSQPRVLEIDVGSCLLLF
jgi:hypothetical protein